MKLIRNPRVTGLACGLIAVALGLGYMRTAGAPASYIIVNVCATIIGVGCFVAFNNAGKRAARIHAAAGVGLVVLLLGTTMFGASVDGATRWVRVGSLTLQLSLILVPMMLVVYAQRRDLIGTASIILVAVTLAAQPDRAMAAALASGTVLLALMVRERFATVAALFAAASFAVTVYRPDRLPAVPYVDRILFTSFDVHVAAGCAVVLGSALLVVPAILGRSTIRLCSVTYAVFGIAWLVVILAAAFGNYPTPIVGYGGSAIVGYFLSLAFLPQPLAVSAMAVSQPFENVASDLKGGRYERQRVVAT
ncbi:MAG TPA: hypothetical protein VM100_03220 [Longimicrobiales bacterium]|nr:hypothetical protein [Longimicrobiales bacterium]